jgi:hypothetical protein
MAIADGPPSVKKVHFSTPVSSVLLAPIVEFATCYVGPDADLEDIEAKATKFLDLVADAEGLVGVSSGWTSEDIDSPDGEGKVKAFVGALGWESVEAHKASASRDAVKQAIGPLIAAIEKIEVVSFVSIGFV